MARRRLLLIIGSLLNIGLAQFGSPAAAASVPECSNAAWLLGECPTIDASNDGDSVTIRGTIDAPGGASGGATSGGGASTPPPQSPTAIDRPGYTATMPVALSDLVNFRPTPGTDQMQPDGWMVVGLDTNFYARAAQHIKTGDLLGQPASVRFTPVRYRWTYGDGSSATRGTPGATWQALGVAEFEPTATSHIYRSPGTYYIDLTIGFSPEYRYAASTTWTPISGVIWVPANRLVAVAGGAKTVLVEDECTANPSGPGC